MTTATAAKQAQRTPGPWHADRVGVIRSNSSSFVAEHTTPADSDFIVTACNAHDDLVAALRIALAYVSNPAASEENAFEATAGNVSAQEATADAIRAALAKVQD